MALRLRTVLVTGGAGCIGRPVCRELTDRGVEVRVFDLPEQIARGGASLQDGVSAHAGSVLDPALLRKAMQGCDAVIHLAAYLGVQRTETHRLRCLDINIQGTKNVLDAAVERDVKKVVFASSSEVYGEPLSNPVSEWTVTQGRTVYAVSKLAGEELCRAYSRAHPTLQHTILRYFNTYGPHQIAQFVIPRFVRNVLTGEPPVIFGDGAQKRSYCYAADTARATVDALLCEEANDQVINIGDATEPLTLCELADRVIDICGKRGVMTPRLEHSFDNADRTPGREIYERYCDGAKARQILGFAPRIRLDEGLRLLIEQGVPHADWPTSAADRET